MFGNFLEIGHFKMSIFIFFQKDFFRKNAIFDFCTIMVYKHEQLYFLCDCTFFLKIYLKNSRHIYRLTNG